MTKRVSVPDLDRHTTHGQRQAAERHRSRTCRAPGYDAVLVEGRLSKGQPGYGSDLTEVASVRLTPVRNAQVGRRSGRRFAAPKTSFAPSSLKLVSGVVEFMLPDLEIRSVEGSVTDLCAVLADP